MGRKNVQPVPQPDDFTCGPSSLKVCLHILGIRKSLKTVISLCKTNRNGTSTANLIQAANKLGLSVMAVQYATLHHLQSALRYSPNKIRASIVSYLYDLDENNEPHPESGHFAAVSSYQSSSGRIVLFDSSDGGMKKSYAWKDFRRRWIDYDYKRRNVTNDSERSFQLIRKWQPQLLLIIAKDEKHLPRFRNAYCQKFVPGNVS